MRERERKTWEEKEKERERISRGRGGRKRGIHYKIRKISYLGACTKFALVKLCAHKKVEWGERENTREVERKRGNDKKRGGVR